MKNPLKTFESNQVGRDFVVGDLHGAFDVFMNLLTNIDFDPTKDRMFSVGDLVDRGPDSIECLSLLKEPWFHSVIANHEQMMLEAFDDGYLGQFWMQNGGHWGARAYLDWRNQLQGKAADAPTTESVRLWDMLDYVRDLPFLMTVKLKSGKRVHIIHAELPPGAEITDEVLEDPVQVHRLATVMDSNGEFFTWGRYLFMRFFREDLSNVAKVKRIVANAGIPSKMFNDRLSHVISGHTIMQRPLTILGQTNIDTGAYGSTSNDARSWEKLTCVELDTWTFYQATATTFGTVEPIVVNNDDILEIQNDKDTAAAG